MKYLLTVAWAIVCMVILFLGHSYWNEKTMVKASPDKIDVSLKTETVAQVDTTKQFALTKNWPEEARQEFQKALQAQKPFKILFAGSLALGTNEQGLAKETAAMVVDAYGEDTVDVSILTYDSTSADFLTSKEHKVMASERADLIIFEPFLLNDNGKVTIDQSLSNLSKIIMDVKAKNPNAVFILQPSYPLFRANHYPLQVEGLKKYAEQNHIAYLDHWTAWPDANTEEIKTYLQLDLSKPNEKGNEVWEKFVADYLISK